MVIFAKSATGAILALGLISLVMLIKVWLGIKSRLRPIHYRFLSVFLIIGAMIFFIKFLSMALKISFCLKYILPSFLNLYGSIIFKMLSPEQIKRFLRHELNSFTQQGLGSMAQNQHDGVERVSIRIQSKRSVKKLQCELRSSRRGIDSRTITIPHI